MITFTVIEAAAEMSKLSSSSRAADEKPGQDENQNFN
jgi:hypothetical protein